MYLALCPIGIMSLREPPESWLLQKTFSDSFLFFPFLKTYCRYWCLRLQSILNYVKCWYKCWFQRSWIRQTRTELIDFSSDENCVLTLNLIHLWKFFTQTQLLSPFSCICGTEFLPALTYFIFIFFIFENYLGNLPSSKIFA